MKQKRIRSKNILLCLLIIISVNEGCGHSKKSEVEEYIGVPLPGSIRDIHFKKINFSNDYKRPYHVYITFKAEQPDIISIVNKLGLVSHESNFKELMCLTDPYAPFVNNIWSFKGRNWYNMNEDIAKNIKWWTPSDKKEMLLYAGFYKEKAANKIEPCYSNRWDGRLLLGYKKSDKTVFILIETLM